MRIFNIIDIYIVKKFLTHFLFMLAMLCLIIVVIDFSEKLEDYLTKKVPYDLLILKYYPTLVLFIANLLSPICVFLSVILFTSKMAQNTELVAMLSSGISFYRLLLPYLITAALLGGGSFYLNGYIVPYAVKERVNFEYDYLKNKSYFSGRNLHRKIDSVNFVTLYSYNQYDKVIDHFQIEQFKHHRLTQRLEARSASYNDTGKVWKMANVKITYLYPDHEYIRKLEKFDTLIGLKPEDIYQRDNYAEGLNLEELQNYIISEKQKGSDILNELILEKYERIAFPFATIILTVIGVALSSRKSRGGTALQIGIGLILGFIYVFTLLSAKVAFADHFPVWVGVWFPNILFSILALILLRWAPK